MLAAVPMTAVAGLADSEGNPAPAAQQQVQNNVRHHTLHRHHSSNGGQALATVRCLEHCCCVRPGRSVRTTGAFPCLETISQFPTNRGFAADDYIFIQDRKSRSGLSGQLYVRIPRFSAAVFRQPVMRRSSVAQGKMRLVLRRFGRYLPDTIVCPGSRTGCRSEAIEDDEGTSRSSSASAPRPQSSSFTIVGPLRCMRRTCRTRSQHTSAASRRCSRSVSSKMLEAADAQLA